MRGLNLDQLRALLEVVEHGASLRRRAGCI